MKKIFILLIAVFCSFAVPVSATNYVKVSSDMTHDMYIDTDSINVIRYAPPLYTIDAYIKDVNLAQGWVGIARVRFFYNINTKAMSISYINGSFDNGNTWMDISDGGATYLPKRSHAYLAGDFAFYKAYHMWFSLIQ